jgi:hypothetical protein
MASSRDSFQSQSPTATGSSSFIRSIEGHPRWPTDATRLETIRDAMAASAEAWGLGSPKQSPRRKVGCRSPDKKASAPHLLTTPNTSPVAQKFPTVVLDQDLAQPSRASTLPSSLQYGTSPCVVSQSPHRYSSPQSREKSKVFDLDHRRKTIDAERCSPPRTSPRRQPQSSSSSPKQAKRNGNQGTTSRMNVMAQLICDQGAF